MNALCRPAAMAGEAHLVPFRTQKLSPRAPMVLRRESVGEQDAAGQQRAFVPEREGSASALPSLCHIYAQPGRRAPASCGALLLSDGTPAGYACSMEALRAAGPPSLCSRPCAPCMRGLHPPGAGGGPIAAIACHICRTAPPACTYAVPGIPCRASACLRVVQKLCRGRNVLAQGGGGAYCYSSRSSAPGNPGRRQRGEP
jgi:hypothetical protein